MMLAFRWSGRGQVSGPRSKEFRSLIVVTAVGMLFTAGCSRPIDSAPTITVEHVISPDPPRVGPATVTFKLADVRTKPISGARVTLEGDMSHAGMAPVFEEAKEIETGQYQAHLRFAMAGDWIILLHIRLPSGQTLERQFSVSGVRPN